MKKYLLFVFAMILSGASFAQISVTGSVGVDGSYTSLTNAGGAFLAINGTAQTGATIVITITADVTTEAGTNGLNAGAWTSLTINPSGGAARTISGTVAGAPLILLNGADYVTINGLNTGGNSLTISNLSSSATSGTCTIKFIADATNNTVTNCSILGSSIVPLGTNGGNIFISTGTTTGNDNNTISYCLIGPAGANLPSKGIYGNGSTTSSAIANSNVTIDHCEIYDFFLAGGCAGVYALTGNTDWTVSSNKIYQTASRAMTSTLTGIYFSNSTYGNNIQILGNKIGYANNAGTGTFTLTGTGSFQGIYMNAMTTAALACNINTNVISDISFTSTSGTFYSIYNATGASSNTININNNYVKNITLVTTTGTFYGIYWSSATNMTITGNNLYSITRNGAGSMYGIYSASSSVNENISSNNIYSLSSTAAAASTFYGIYQLTAAGTKTFQNNVIHDLTGAGSSSIYGLYINYGTTVAINNNWVYSLSSTGGSGGTVTGIYTGSTATTMNIFQNKVCDLSSTSSAPLVSGILIGGGTTRNVYNNLIGNLTASAANVTEAIRGINVNASTASSNVNVYYNTVYINATSSGVNFGTTGIFHSASATSTTEALDLRNNIIVNSSTANGTGLTVAFRRSAGTAGTLANYANTSNYNDFYAGVPSATNLIYNDGTSSAQTIAAYRAGVFTAGTIAPRDASSVTENPTFLSTSCGDPTFLHINTGPATQLESGGGTIATYLTDYDGDYRFGNPLYTGTGTAPDIGADEFNGTYIDLTPPIITYTPLLNTSSLLNRTLAVTITDASGVGAGANLPVLYWRINAAPWPWTGPIAPTSVVGNVYTYTFGAGVALGDVVSYFVVAQDASPSANVGSYPLGATVTNNPPLATAPPPSPSTYTISNVPLAGDYTVGAAGTYLTITAAVADLNLRGVSAPVRFLLNDVSYTTGETYPITVNLTNESLPTAANPVTIKPNTGVISLIQGVSAGSQIFRIRNSYITIDGSNSTGGTTRNLTIQNTSATTPQVIGISSTGTTPITDVTVKNSIIINGVNSSSAFVVSDLAGTPGYFNNITVQNNSIQLAYIGVYFTANPLAGNGSGTLITGNDLNTAGANSIRLCALYVQGVDGATVSNNNIGNMANTTDAGNYTGIWFATATINSTISGNTISTMSSTTAGPRGIAISSSLTNSNLNITGNTISALSTSSSGTPYGIYILSTTTNVTVQKNKISDILNSYASGSGGARGINVVTGIVSSNITLKNNFVWNVRAYGYSSITYGGIGIGIDGATGGVKVYDNSVNLYGTLAGYATSTMSAAFAVLTSTVTSLDVRDNIFVNTFDNTSGVSDKSYAIYSAAANTAFTNINYNDYYVSGAPGVLGYLGADQATLALWQTATGQDGFSVSGDPKYVSNTDLHIQPAVFSPVNNTGVSLTPDVTDDIDGDVRTATPDIGADEYTPSSGVDMGAIALFAPGVGCYTTTETVTITIKNYQSTTIDFSVNPVTVSATATGGYSSNKVVNSGTLASGATLNVTMLATIDMSAPGSYTFNANTSVGGDLNPGNDAMTPVTRTSLTLGGPYNVGSGGAYTTLTAAVAAYNSASCITGPITFNLTDATYLSEVFPIVINANPGANATNTLTIKPSIGVTPTLSGSVASGALIKLNGADYIIIDGSNSGGTDKSLTITNTSTTSPTAISLMSLGTGAGATNDIIKNCNISTGISTLTGYGIAVGGATPGTSGADNDYVTLQNNSITVATIPIYAYGTASVSAGGMDNLTVKGNSVNTNTTITNIGIQVGNGLNCNINNNTISVTTSYSGQPVGISLETGFVSSTVNANNITNVTTTATGGYGGRGITIGTGTATSALTISNNFISGVNGSNYSGFSNSSSMGIGLGVSGGGSLTTVTGGVNLYFNSVNMYGPYSYSASCLTAAIYIGSSASALDIRDNIFVNTLNNTNAGGTLSKNYAIYSLVANTAFTDINYNDYYVSGTQGVLGFLTSDQTTLLAWQGATGKDAFSVSGDPKFLNNSDLHIQTNVISPVSNAGTTIASILTDIDGDTRTATPDIGADEYIYAPPSVDPPTGVLATAISSSQINVAYAKNLAVDPVVIIWDFDGTFTPPAGPPPAIGAIFAGGKVLSDGSIASPVPHTSLTQSTHYYYMAFSYHAATLAYSVGVLTDAITQCDQLTDFSESFDGVTPPVLPVCWSGYISPAHASEYVQTTTSLPNSSPNCVVLYSYDATLAADAPLLVTPPLSDLNAGTHWLKFAAKGASTNLSVIVGTMSDPTNSATFTPFATVTGLSTTAWKNEYVNFSTYTGTDKYIAFQHPLTTTYSYIYIDDAVWTTTGPTLFADPASLAFGFVPVGGTSTEQTYSLSGLFLSGTGDITVTAPTDFEVSLTTGIGFGSSVLVPFTGPTLAATTIYVRFKPTLASTNYSGNITNAGGGATTVNVAVTGTTNLVYCTPTSSCGSSDVITNVTFAGINNTTGCGGTNGYNDFTGGTPAAVTASSTYTFTGTVTNGGTEYLAIWIDFNHNGVFDASEFFAIGSGPGGTFTNSSIVVPGGAYIGSTHLRVRVRYGTALTSADACLSYSYGETEDYTVNISAATTPTLSAAPSTLAFGYTPVGGTSAPQSYLLTGLNLTPASGSITVTAPTGFQVCLTSGGTYGPSVLVSYSGSAVSQIIYAEFAPATPGVYSDNITNVGGGASTNVLVTGTTTLVYCAAGSITCDEFISRVQLNTIDNSSACSAGGYANYTAISTNLIIGGNYTITVTNGPPTYTGDQCGIWIDWNNNGSFYDAGEAITVTGGVSIYTATITPPTGAVLTGVRMRIRITYTGTVDPCGTTSYGEVEDYTILLTPPLALDAATLSIDNVPTANAPGVILTPKATVKNVGTTNPVTFNVTMTATDGYSSTVSSGPLASGAQTQVTFANWTPANGIWTATVCTQLAGDGNTTNDCKSETILVKDLNKQVYGYNAYVGTGPGPAGPTTFNLSTPGTLNSLANQSTLDFVNGGTWANGIWYGEVSNSITLLSDLVTLDPVTGARTLIGSLGVAVNDISYNPVNNTMYAVIGSSLYTVDMTTGLATLVGGSTAGIDYYNIAIDAAGQAYGIDGAGATLGTIDLTTGAYTVIGSLGYTTYYAQGMEFDRTTGDLYISAYGSDGFLAMANKATGAAIKIGDFQGGGEVTGFAIPYSSNKTLNLTSVFLEGLYDPTTGAMNQAKGAGGVPEFGGTVADAISVELHNAVTYGTIEYTVATPVYLDVTGTATVTIPASYSGSYYITIKHRNSIETTTKLPVSFASATINYAFNTNTQAFDNYLKSITGAFPKYVIYTGDVNQDGAVGVPDMTGIDNKSKIFATGYLPEDVNGDGAVGVPDMTLVDNNSKLFVAKHVPIP